MGHIHSNFGQHDFTASAFIVRTDFNEPKNNGTQANHWQHVPVWWSR